MEYNKTDLKSKINKTFLVNDIQTSGKYFKNTQSQNKLNDMQKLYGNEGGIGKQSE